MTAYMIFTRLKTTDQAMMDEYAKHGPGTAAGHDLSVLTAYGAYEVLEGPQHEGMVILAFPSRDAALAWYAGEAYTKARAWRFKGADYQVTLIEGLVS